MIEREKKVLLTNQEYETILNLYGGGVSTAVQVNHYYDTKDLGMNEKRITCRVRESNGKLRATLKAHGNDGPSDNSMETDMGYVSNVKQNCFTDMGLLLHGTLVTYRTILLKNAAFEMVLDRNEYMGHTDFELEIEYVEGCESGAQDVLNSLMQRLGVYDKVGKYRDCKSKSERFFERRRLYDVDSQ